MSKFCIPFIMGDTMMSASVEEGKIVIGSGYYSYVEALRKWEELGNEFPNIRGIYGLKAKYKDKDIQLYVDEEESPWATLYMDKNMLVLWEGVLDTYEDTGYVVEFFPLTKFSKLDDDFMCAWNAEVERGQVMSSDNN